MLRLRLMHRAARRNHQFSSWDRPDRVRVGLPTAIYFSSVWDDRVLAFAAAATTTNKRASTLTKFRLSPWDDGHVRCVCPFQPMLCYQPAPYQTCTGTAGVRCGKYQVNAGVDVETADPLAWFLFPLHFCLAALLHANHPPRCAVDMEHARVTAEQWTVNASTFDTGIRSPIASETV